MHDKIGKDLPFGLGFFKNPVDHGVGQEFCFEGLSIKDEEMGMGEGTDAKKTVDYR